MGEQAVSIHKHMRQAMRKHDATYGRTDGLTNEDACYSPQPIFHVRLAHARTTIMTSLGEL
jgi:hypothetical protein